MKVILQLGFWCLLTIPVTAQGNMMTIEYLDTMALTQENFELVDQYQWSAYHDKRFEETLPFFKALWERGLSSYSATQDSMSYLFYGLGKGAYGQWLTSLGRYNEGLPIFEEALKDLEEFFGPVMRLSYGYVGLGFAYTQFGDPYRALWAHNQAERIVSLHVKPGDSNYELVGHKLGNLARVYANLNQSAKAFQLFEDAERAYRTANAPWGVHSTLCGRGEIAANNGNFVLAKKYLDSARQYQENNLPSVFGFIYMNYFEGIIREKIGDQNIALAHYAAADQLIEKVIANKSSLSSGYSNTISALCLNYADCLMTLGEITEAKRVLKSGRNVHKKVTLDQNNIESLNYRLLEAKIAAADNDLPAAAKQIERTIAILTNQAEVDWLSPEPDSALLTSSPILAKAFRISAEIQDAAGTYSANTILANCRAGKAMLRKMQLSYAPDVTMDWLIKENASLYELSVAKAYAEASGASNRESIENYFSAIEEARDQQLLTSIDTREEVAYGLPTELKTAEAEARQELRSYERLLTYEQGKAVKNTELIFSYQSHLRSARNALDSVSSVIEESFPEYYSLKFRETALRLDEVQDKLSAGEAMVCYYVASGGVYALMITAEEAIPFKSELSEQLIKDFNETLLKPTSAPGSEWQERSFALYEQLLGPLKDREIDQLIVIPDKALSFLAWPALLTTRADDADNWRELPYLIHSLSLRQESSAGVYVNQYERRGKKQAYAYAGFAPDYDGEVLSIREDTTSINDDLFFPEYTRQMSGRLVYNGEEVKRASSLFDEPVAEIGSGATEAFFKEVAGSASILHIASHGITSAYDPAASHLVFSTPGQDEAEDGRLHAWEIYGMDLPVDLTVLSACQTGTGVIRTGTGVLSLARAFRYAGSKDVVMSLWSVNDRSTYQVMTDFFKGLDGKQDKASALRGAMIRHLETEKNAELTHPYYWAGFSLVGPGKSLDKGKNVMLWVGLGAVFSIMFFGWIRRKT